MLISLYFLKSFILFQFSFLDRDPGGKRKVDPDPQPFELTVFRIRLKKAARIRALIKKVN